RGNRPIVRSRCNGWKNLTSTRKVEFVAHQQRRNGNRRRGLNGRRGKRKRFAQQLDDIKPGAHQSSAKHQRHGQEHCCKRSGAAIQKSQIPSPSLDVRESSQEGSGNPWKTGSLWN